MKSLIWILIFISFLNLHSQNEDVSNMMLKKKLPEGTDFWLCFMRNHNDAEEGKKETAPLDLKLFITSNYDANVTIEIKSINYKETIFVKAKTVKDIQISPLAQIKSSEIVESQRAVHVSSDLPISVYGLNRRRLTTDSFLGLPLNVLGTRYRAICYDVSVSLMSEFAIVATENNTEIQIIPSVDTDYGQKAGLPFYITLNKGDVYQVAASNKKNCINKCDLTGSLITANKKIAFFSGHQCAYVPSEIIACNHLVEQIPPTSSWGKHFYIGEFKKRSRYNYRVLADSNDSRVFEDGKLIGILSEGQHLEREVNRSVQITATKPVLVAQYSQGFDNGDNIGDPMMLLVSPTQQYLKKYRFATPVNGFWEHFINVIVPTKAIPSMKLNGVKINQNKFSVLGNSRYSLASISVNYGTHVIEANEPFGMTSYGFGFDADKYDAYGTLGGQSFDDYIEIPDTLAPIAEVIDEKDSIKVIIRDDRNIDKGLKKIEFLENTIVDYFDVDGVINYGNINTSFEDGTPLSVLKLLKSKLSRSSGKLVFTAIDLVGNSRDYTLCYYYDTDRSSYVYKLNEGLEVECSKKSPTHYGAFLSYNYITHTSNFTNTGNLISKGFFGDATGQATAFGLLISHQVASSFYINSRIDFHKFSGVLEAPDSMISSIRVGESLENYQESTQLSLNSIYVNWSFGFEFDLNNNIYLSSGIMFSFPFTSNVIAQTKILQPSNYVYDNGTNTQDVGIDELSSINSLGTSAYLGLGFKQAISTKFDLFTEMNYMQRFTNIVDDSDWTLNRLSILLGVRFYK